MTDLLALSTQIIDDGAELFPVRINQELSEISDDIAVVESFSNVVALRTDAGLVLSDTSGAVTGPSVGPGGRLILNRTLVKWHSNTDGGAILLREGALSIRG